VSGAAARYHCRMMFRNVSAAVLLCVFVQQPAYAYIDPGTGSLVLQGLVAFVVGAAFTLKTFFYERIKPLVDWVLRRPRAAKPAEPDAATDDTTKDS
jgi:hypothetical protein